MPTARDSLDPLLLWKMKLRHETAGDCLLVVRIGASVLSQRALLPLILEFCQLVDHSILFEKDWEPMGTDFEMGTANALALGVWYVKTVSSHAEIFVDTPLIIPTITTRISSHLNLDDIVFVQCASYMARSTLMRAKSRWWSALVQARDKQKTKKRKPLLFIVFQKKS